MKRQRAEGLLQSCILLADDEFRAEFNSNEENPPENPVLFVDKSQMDYTIFHRTLCNLLPLERSSMLDVTTSYYDSDEDEIPLESEYEFRELMQITANRSKKGKFTVLHLLPKYTQPESNLGDLKVGNVKMNQAKYIDETPMACSQEDSGMMEEEFGVKLNSVEEPPAWFKKYMHEFKEEITSTIIKSIVPILKSERSLIHSEVTEPPPEGSTDESGHDFSARNVQSCRDSILLKKIGKLHKREKKLEKKLDSKLEKLEHKTKCIMEKRALKQQKQTQQQIENVSHPSKLKSKSCKMGLGEISDIAGPCVRGPPLRNCVDRHIPFGVPFSKIWHVINNGTIQWTNKTELRYSWGTCGLEPISKVIKCPPLKIGAKGQIVAGFGAPTPPGIYVSYWHFYHKGQPFGCGKWLCCAVQVDPPTGQQSKYGNEMPSLINVAPTEVAGEQNKEVEMVTLQMCQPSVQNIQASAEPPTQKQKGGEPFVSPVTPLQITNEKLKQLTVPKQTEKQNTADQEPCNAMVQKNSEDIVFNTSKSGKEPRTPADRREDENSNDGDNEDDNKDDYEYANDDMGKVGSDEEDDDGSISIVSGEISITETESDDDQGTMDSKFVVIPMPSCFDMCDKSSAFTAPRVLPDAALDAETGESSEEDHRPIVKKRSEQREESLKFPPAVASNQSKNLSSDERIRKRDTGNRDLEAVKHLQSATSEKNKSQQVNDRNTDMKNLYKRCQQKKPQKKMCGKNSQPGWKKVGEQQAEGGDRHLKWAHLFNFAAPDVETGESSKVDKKQVVKKYSDQRENTYKFLPCVVATNQSENFSSDEQISKLQSCGTDDQDQEELKLVQRATSEQNNSQQDSDCNTDVKKLLKHSQQTKPQNSQPVWTKQGEQQAETSDKHVPILPEKFMHIAASAFSTACNVLGSLGSRKCDHEGSNLPLHQHTVPHRHHLCSQLLLFEEIRRNLQIQNPELGCWICGDHTEMKEEQETLSPQPASARASQTSAKVTSPSSSLSSSGCISLNDTSESCLECGSHKIKYPTVLWHAVLNDVSSSSDDDVPLSDGIKDNPQRYAPPSKKENKIMSDNIPKIQE